MVQTSDCQIKCHENSEEVIRDQEIIIKKVEFLINPDYQSVGIDREVGSWGGLWGRIDSAFPVETAI